MEKCRFVQYIYENCTQNKPYWIKLLYFSNYLTFSLFFLNIYEVIQTRMMYLDRFGIYERNRKETMKHFFQSKTFQKHMASLFPLDLFYFVFGFTGRATLLRIPRLLRAYHFEDLFERLDNAFKFPMTIRLTRTINIMLFLIHLTSCAYFTFSDYKVSISNNTYLPSLCIYY